MDEKHWKDPSPWVPMTKAIDQKHIGKLLEELGECVEAVALVVIEAEHRALYKLENELADVRCGIELAQEHFGLAPGMQAANDAPDDYVESLVRLLGVAIAASSRCFIQGINECEPVTKLPNRDWLQGAFWNLSAAIFNVTNRLQLDTVRMEKRIEFKKKHLRAWHGMLAEASS